VTENNRVSQIIERNLYLRESQGDALWINPEKDDSWQTVKRSCNSLKLFSQDFGTYRFLKQAGGDAEFSAFPEADVERYQWIIINLPRQKALLNMLLDCAAGLLAENGVLWLAGENKAGIKSSVKHLKSYFGQIKKLDNARHCSLFEASEILNRSPFDPLLYRQEWLLDCNHAELKIASYPGVFAHGRLDAGSNLLLGVLADLQIAGDVLDFACGAGLIGGCIAAGQPQASVTLLDSSAMALRACEETLAANQLNATVLASDGLSELGESFDLVVSNPPIHSGVKTDNRLGMRLLESVFEYIRPGGMLIMVANIHLPYEKWLSQKSSYCTDMISDDNYKVILAKK